MSTGIDMDNVSWEWDSTTPTTATPTIPVGGTWTSIIDPDANRLAELEQRMERMEEHIIKLIDIIEEQNAQL